MSARGDHPAIDDTGGRLFAGLDVSTQSCKLVVINPATAEVVYVDRVVYDDDFPQYGTKDGVIADAPEGVAESDPRMWVEAVETGASVADLIPVNAPPTPGTAEDLRRRLDFLQAKILPDYTQKNR